MPLLHKHPATHDKLEKLAESLSDMLTKLRASARAMADHQVSMEERIRLIEAGEA
jgi:hypothetical protein